MLYIFNQAILVEIKQLNNEDYLIGEQIYKNVPQSILKNSFNSANWNRAIKFKTKEVESQISIGYFMIKMEIYYDYKNKQLVYISKNQFHQKILNQDFFKHNFAKQIFDFRNRNKLTFINKDIEQLNFDNNNYEIIDNVEVDLNRCFINNEYQIKKQKYKVLFKFSDNYKIENNLNGQTIYSIPFSDKLITLIDSKTNQIYIQGKFNLEHELCLDIQYEDFEITKQLINNLINWIQNTVEPKTTNWHLFNITRDNKYLIAEMQKLINNVDNYTELKDYLIKVFNDLKINFNNSLYSCQEVKDLLIQHTTDFDELKELEIDIKRYGILNDNDSEKIDKKYRF